MIQRFAAHYIYASGKLYPKYVIEANSTCISTYRLFPLEKESEAVMFFNGIIAVAGPETDADEMRVLLRDAVRSNDDMLNFFSIFDVPSKEISDAGCSFFLFDNIDFSQMAFLPETYVIRIYP